MLHGCNIFRLRAKWSRAKRKFVMPSVNVPLAKRPDDTPVELVQYLMAHVHLARLWREKLPSELEWFLASLRGELPPAKKPLKNYHVHYVTLPPKQYFLALEVLTTRMGVKPSEAQP